MKLKKLIIIFTAALLCISNISGVSAENTKATVSEETISFYEQWKNKYLIENPYTDEKQYYVQYSEESYDEAQEEVAVTVSEAHGYGMLIAVNMAEYDNTAKEIFDGMYNYYKSHLSSIGPNLMAWQQNDTGTAIVNASGADSATDGDMDIAYSLLAADKLWGSSGSINYRDAAINIINDIMIYEVNKTDWILQLGDWTYDLSEGDKYYSATRSSDFIVQYLPVFAEVTDDDRWMKVYDSTYSIINSFVSEYSTGLLPDFIVKDKTTEKFVPASENYLESENDGNYYYNSCRTPWRIGMDYLYGKGDNALSFAKTINSFIVGSANGNPENIKAGYKPDGTAVEDYNDLCFTAPFLISASCAGDKQWHDSIRSDILNYGEDVYYGDTIKLLCLIADDGAWIVPDVAEWVAGDVNADGVFNIADSIALQKWLTCTGELLNPEAGDMNSDNMLNVFDLCLMQRILTGHIK